jgi:uncharacterized Rossmann fold enzyme
MNFNDWKELYYQISDDLNIDREQDEIAATLLDHLIRSYQKNLVRIEQLNDLIRDKSVYVFGAAPSLESDIQKNSVLFKNKTLIAADGATSALLKYDIIPTIIVTDLDGVISDQLNANMLHSILVVHAHGDNTNVVQQTIPRIKGLYCGTIQTDPSKHEFVHNFGGFTDGDRAVFLADQFQPREIILCGFNCDSEPGFFSYQKKGNELMKKKKLSWCKKLLNLFPDGYVKHI